MKDLRQPSRPSDCVRRQRGVTLIELLVVMVIISLFATIVGARLFSNVDRARQTTAKAQISEFETVLDLFRLDIGRYPTGAEGLQALRNDPGSIRNWDGPYLAKQVPLEFHGIDRTCIDILENLGILTFSRSVPMARKVVRARIWTS